MIKHVHKALLSDIRPKIVLFHPYFERESVGRPSFFVFVFWFCFVFFTSTFFALEF